MSDVHNANSAQSPHVVQITEDDLRQAVGRHQCAYLGLSEDTFHSPSVDEMERAEELGNRLLARMRELVATGVDPTSMGMEDLLPGVNPDDFEIGIDLNHQLDMNPTGGPVATTTLVNPSGAKWLKFNFRR